MAQCGTCHHMEEEIIAVQNGEKGAMMRGGTLRCSVTILAQEVSPVSSLHDRHRFGADLLFPMADSAMLVNSLHGERVRTCSAAAQKHLRRGITPPLG